MARGSRRVLLSVLNREVIGLPGIVDVRVKAKGKGARARGQLLTLDMRSTDSVVRQLSRVDPQFKSARSSEKCPVLKASPDAVRASRLLLCDLTARTIRKGLELLGIKVVEKM